MCFSKSGRAPGILTLRLAPRVARLVAVEIDRDLIAGLTPKLPANATIVAGDVLDIDLAAALLGRRRRVRFASRATFRTTSPRRFCSACSISSRKRPGQRCHADASARGRRSHCRQAGHGRVRRAERAGSVAGGGDASARPPSRRVPAAARGQIGADPADVPASPDSRWTTLRSSNGWSAACSRSGERPWATRWRSLRREIGASPRGRS